MAERIIISYELDDNGVPQKVKKFTGQLENDVPKAASSASAGFSKLTSVLSGMAVTFATVKLGQFMRESIQNGAEQERVLQSLGVALKNVGVAYNDVGGELQGMIGQMMRATTYGDDELAGTLRDLIDVTGSYEAGLKLLAPTLDFAAQKEIDLGTAARLAGQAATDDQIYTATGAYFVEQYFSFQAESCNRQNKKNLGIDFGGFECVEDIEYYLNTIKAAIQ
jgi:hypothetical protein